MTFERAISAGPSSGAPSFASHVSGPMPRGLREEADAMSFETFLDQYAPSTGPLRLGQWDCTDAERPATRLGPQARNYQATLAVGDRISTSSAKASGPVAALTEMLYERGIAVEMTAFHQLPAGESTATFVCGSDGGHSEWAMGLADDPTQSALRAVIACANRLLARA
ncbi:MAG: homocitrate synthase [Mycobacterium sp.]